MSLPMKFRKTYDRALEKEEIDSIDLVIAPSIKKTADGCECLCVYTTEDFDEFVNSIFESFGGFNPRNKEHEKIRRALHADVEDITIDAAKRITIPTKLKEKAGLDKDVALVGYYGRIEIWDTKRIEDELESTDLESLIYE